MKNSLFLLIFVSIFLMGYGQKINFYRIKEKKINLSEKLGIKSDSTVHSFSSFRISKQITLKQYKQYLRSIEKDSSYAFFLSQLPKIERQESLTKNYLNASDFDDEPVIGVSMDNACNFAVWYSSIQGSDKVKYRLPMVFEWISMNEETEKKSDNTKKNKLVGPILDWTINAFDESAYLFQNPSKFPVGYLYKHSKYDHKVLKRKSVIGRSFRISLADPVKISSLYSYYADEGYADVGFRLIEVGRVDPFEKYTKQEPIQSDINLKSISSLKTLPYSMELVEQHSIELNDQLVEYATKNGQLDGTFKVYKQVGNNKVTIVKGEIRNNCRVGYWTIYDEKDPSKILIKRLYRSHLEFEQLLPNHSSSKIIPFVTKNMNPTLGLNDDGYKEYAYVTSADFIFSSRLYREILFEKNKIPFNEIIELLKTTIDKKEIIVYDTSNFRTIREDNPFENFTGNIIGFRIKEDFFFDKNRKLSETRIIGLAPIYFDSTVNDNRELCWLYFPQLRKHLVKIHDSFSGSNLDNLFFERNFFGEVYQTQNSYDKMDAESIKKDLKFKDIELLLTEHQIWLFLEGKVEWY